MIRDSGTQSVRSKSPFRSAKVVNFALALIGFRLVSDSLDSKGTHGDLRTGLLETSRPKQALHRRSMSELHGEVFEGGEGKGCFGKISGRMVAAPQANQQISSSHFARRAAWSICFRILQDF